jgi:hypothetical protein
MKDLLYICIKNPFTQRDLDRMGIEVLERHFEVRILDCTAWLMPKAYETRGRSTITRHNLRAIRSLHELKDELRDVNGGFAIDYVGQFSIRAILLFHLLKSRGCKLIAMDSGAYPSPELATGKCSAVKKILDAIRHGGLWQHLNARIIKLLLKCLPDQTPDYALVSGTSWTADPRFSGAAKIIPAHSFDYERYLELRGAPRFLNHDYAVYVDEDIAGHEDNAELGFDMPVSASRFYGALSRFLGDFEAAAGMPVVVAGYPSDRAAATERFNGREVVWGKTAELIRNAKVVFAHASTAISYAVLWRRPLVFLTTDEMNDSWYRPWLESPRKILNSPIANIDLDVPGPLNVEEWQKVDERAYKQYEETYLRSMDSPDDSLWSIFLSVKKA